MDASIKVAIGEPMLRLIAIQLDGAWDDCVSQPCVMAGIGPDAEANNEARTDEDRMGKGGRRGKNQQPTQATIRYYTSVRVRAASGLTRRLASFGAPFVTSVDVRASSVPLVDSRLTR
jgi:hypothetical protein